MPGTVPASDAAAATCAHHWLLISTQHGPHATYGCQQCMATAKGYEAIPEFRLSKDELLAEARRALRESEQAEATGSTSDSRDLRCAWRALDSALSAGEDTPAAWSRAHPAPGEAESDGADGWTVIGVWLSCTPVPVGAVSGNHNVYGGDGQEFPDGLWATHVDADDVDAAEAAAIAGMRSAYEDR